MAIVYTDTIEPRKPTQEITLGTTGETITFPGNDLRVNTVKDKGGNTLWTSDGSGNLSSVNSALKSNEVLLSTQTASGDASIEFTSGIDSTYDVYIFRFINISPTTDDVNFTFQTNAVGQSGFNETITCTYFSASHSEAGAGANVTYKTSHDQGQGTAYQIIAFSLGSDADQCCGGELHLFAPSSTTYVKQFYTRINTGHAAEYCEDTFVAGYFNTTAAIDEISFKMASGNMDGEIKMYGLL